MLLEADPAKPLLDVAKYARRMGVSRQAVYYQLSKGQCLVAPIDGVKPPKWFVSDVDAFFARAADGGGA